MSWDQLEGQWKQRRGNALNQWGKMMNDELAAVSGKYVELVGRLQEKYGNAKEQVDCFKLECRECRRRTVEQLKKANSKLMKVQKALSEEKRARKKALGSKAPARKKTRNRRTGQPNANRGKNV